MCNNQQQERSSKHGKVDAQTDVLWQQQRGKTCQTEVDFTTYSILRYQVKKRREM